MPRRNAPKKVGDVVGVGPSSKPESSVEDHRTDQGAVGGVKATGTGPPSAGGEFLPDPAHTI